jgi:cation-transporting P-type ATPase C
MIVTIVDRAVTEGASVADLPAVNSTYSTCCPVGRDLKNTPQKNHVSGPVLVLSGLYLLYLYGKQLLQPAVTMTSLATRILSLPSLVAFGLSLPVQRQALDNLKKTGKPDMGLISTGLLYVSILTGNVVAALTIFWLFNLASWLEDRIRIRTRQAVRSMLGSQVGTVWLVRDDTTEIEVAADSLQAGDIVSLRLGNVVPIDGTVVQGRALVNESTLTGESRPVPKDRDATVLAGTTVEEGHILVRVDKAGEETRLAAIIRLIETAESHPGELQLTSRRFSQAMVPVSLGLAAVAFVVTGNLLQAMAVLIITCPCALRLSTSVAVSASMSRAARQGILIKGGRYVEIVGQVNVLVLDKTGTLTHAASEVVKVVVLDRRYRSRTILALAACAQKPWPHPLARAVVNHARELEIRLPGCDQSELIPGRGIQALTENREVLVGNRKLLEEHGIDCSRLDKSLRIGSGENGLLLVAAHNRLIGLILTRSKIPEHLRASLEHIREIGIRRIVLLTGDTEAGTEQLKKEFHFDEIHCSLAPEDKARWIRKWKAEHPDDVVAMVGDGINDTPAFAAADVSLAIGEGGSNVTVEYADIVLQPGTIVQVGETLELGRETLKRIKESYALAIGMNSSILVATTLGLVSPVAGALLHNFITLAAVGNAGRLRAHGKARKT